MSDPLTNAEMEDVLSSIRRLVSEDRRKEQSANSAEETAESRLVLTPAQRVETAEGIELVMEADLSEASEPSEQEVKADWEWSRPEPEEDAAETSVEDALAAQSVSAVSEKIAQAIDDNAGSGEPATGAPVPENFVWQAERSLTNPQTGAEDAPIDIAQDATPDTTENAGTRPVSAEPTPTPVTARTTAEMTLGDKIAALESLVARHEDTWEPDTVGADDYAGTEDPALDWADDAAEEPIASDVQPDQAPANETLEIASKDPSGELAEDVRCDVTDVVDATVAPNESPEDADDEVDPYEDEEIAAEAIRDVADLAAAASLEPEDSPTIAEADEPAEAPLAQEQQDEVAPEAVIESEPNPVSAHVGHAVSAMLYHPRTEPEVTEQSGKSVDEPITEAFVAPEVEEEVAEAELAEPLLAERAVEELPAQDATFEEATVDDATFEEAPFIDVAEAEMEEALSPLDEADILDEAALRELVADIVREELQGALGERITRNVRKLVRREIHRALAAQDLE